MSKPDWNKNAKDATESAEDAAAKAGKPNFMKKAKAKVEDAAEKASAGKPDFLKKAQAKAEEVVADAADAVKTGKPDFMKKAVDDVKEKAEEVVAEVAGGEQEHTVVSGDNLSYISKKYYGTTNNWKVIFEANKDVLKDPNLIRPGMVLKIPKID